MPGRALRGHSELPSEPAGGRSHGRQSGKRHAARSLLEKSLQSARPGRSSAPALSRQHTHPTFGHEAPQFAKLLWGALSTPFPPQSTAWAPLCQPPPSTSAPPLPPPHCRCFCLIGSLGLSWWFCVTSCGAELFSSCLRLIHSEVLSCTLGAPAFTVPPSGPLQRAPGKRPRSLLRLLHAPWEAEADPLGKCRFTATTVEQTLMPVL